MEKELIEVKEVYLDKLSNYIEVDGRAYRYTKLIEEDK